MVAAHCVMPQQTNQTQVSKYVPTIMMSFVECRIKHVTPSVIDDMLDSEQLSR